jgi:hypothetical protein
MQTKVPLGPLLAQFLVMIQPLEETPWLKKLMMILIRALDDNKANEVGDGGTSDAEGDGYKCVVSFKDGMKEVELERLCFDANEIESGVEVDDNDAFMCEVKDNSSNSSLYGALPGWSAPSAPTDDWNPTVNINR